MGARHRYTSCWKNILMVYYLVSPQTYMWFWREEEEPMGDKEGNTKAKMCMYV